jgi:hypothetical protein
VVYDVNKSRGFPTFFRTDAKFIRDLMPPVSNSLHFLQLVLNADEALKLLCCVCHNLVILPIQSKTTWTCGPPAATCAMTTTRTTVLTCIRPSLRTIHLTKPKTCAIFDEITFVNRSTEQVVYGLWWGLCRSVYLSVRHNKSAVCL